MVAVMMRRVVHLPDIPGLRMCTVVDHPYVTDSHLSASYEDLKAQERAHLALTLLFFTMRRVVFSLRNRSSFPHVPNGESDSPESTPEESDRSSTPEQNRPKSLIPERFIPGILSCSHTSGHTSLRNILTFLTLMTERPALGPWEGHI